MSPSAALSRWVDYTAHVTRQSARAFPTLGVLDLLHETFEATVEWNCLHQDGTLNWVFLDPPAGWPPPDSRDYVLAHLNEHPLIRWFGQTHTIAPMTIDRVPEVVASRRLVAAARETLGSPDMAHALAIPVALADRSHSVVVLSRGAEDFSAGQFDLAHQLQPLLMLMDRHATLSARLGEDTARRFELTTRESAVLSLLRQGRTVSAIGHHLCCSPRTVEKHLEHLYRKLDVRDRLGAVRVADAHDTATSAPPESPGARQLASHTSRLQETPVRGKDRPEVLVFSGTMPGREPVYPSHTTTVRIEG
jgi:DNA-binding CsgD family transcriptional regulator